jgi:hypothetical protein
MPALADSVAKTEIIVYGLLEISERAAQNPTYSGGILLEIVVDTMTHAPDALDNDHEVFSPSLFRLAYSSVLSQAERLRTPEGGYSGLHVAGSAADRVALRLGA